MTKVYEFGCPPGKGYNLQGCLASYTRQYRHDYIGKRATFTYFERTPAGSYRHPMFTKLYVIMSKLIYQLYNDNMISEEVVHLLLDAHYNRVNKTRYR